MLPLLLSSWGCVWGRTGATPIKLIIRRVYANAANCAGAIKLSVWAAKCWPTFAFIAFGNDSCSRRREGRWREREGREGEGEREREAGNSLWTALVAIDFIRILWINYLCSCHCSAFLYHSQLKHSCTSYCCCCCCNKSIYEQLQRGTSIWHAATAIETCRAATWQQSQSQLGLAEREILLKWTRRAKLLDLFPTDL